MAEAGVVGPPDPLTGQSSLAFVVPKGTPLAGEELPSQLRAHVTDVLGPVARPHRVLVVPDLPKTRSGKIMRRLLLDLATTGHLGDTTAIQDQTVLEASSTPSAAPGESVLFACAITVSRSADAPKRCPDSTVFIGATRKIDADVTRGSEVCR